MDPTTLAITVAGLLAKKAIEKIGDEAGEGFAGALARISSRVKSWFFDRSDDEGIELVERLNQLPTREGRVRELAEVLAERLAADPGFSTELERLVAAAESEDKATASGFVTTVRDNARVGKIINVGTANDLRF